ncbi:hypothetical protein NC652_033242 [Populus alba x Populus x berolinensis]|nr:hypothetical protein NC652_033242 [Populus alba x Populus x berolinensis]
MWFSSPTGRLKDNLRFGHGLFKPSRISYCIQTLGAGLRANPIRNKSCYRSHLCLTVLVSVHNLSATIRDLRVDYDVVI